MKLKNSQGIDNVQWGDPYGAAYDTTAPRALKLDDYTTADVIYIGKAQVGTAGSTAAWQIMKVDQTTGLVITWADSNDKFDNVWDNRASLTYG